MSGREREGGEAATETKETAPYIPLVLCEQILYLLSSNDLINYKPVCKDWLRLISSTEFIQKHLERSKADRNDSIIVVPRSGRSYYTHNCFKARGAVHPYTRGCSAITRCRRLLSNA